MKTFLLTLALAVTAFIPIAASAAEGDSTATAAMECCNTTCPICDMAVDKAHHSAFIASDAVKSKHSGIHTAHVGFCSAKCKVAYEKDPAKYEEKLIPQWQKSKNTPVKGS